VNDVIPACPPTKPASARHENNRGEQPRFSDKGLAHRRWQRPDCQDKLELLVENGEFFRVLSVDYHGGDRFAVLERAAGTEDVFDGDLPRAEVRRVQHAAAKARVRRRASELLATGRSGPRKSRGPRAVRCGPGVDPLQHPWKPGSSPMALRFDATLKDIVADHPRRFRGGVWPAHERTRNNAQC